MAQRREILWYWTRADWLGFLLPILSTGLVFVSAAFFLQPSSELEASSGPFLPGAASDVATPTVAAGMQEHPLDSVQVLGSSLSAPSASATERPQAEQHEQSPSDVRSMAQPEEPPRTLEEEAHESPAVQPEPPPRPLAGRALAGLTNSLSIQAPPDEPPANVTEAPPDAAPPTNPRARTENRENAPPSRARGAERGRDADEEEKGERNWGMAGASALEER